MDAGFIGLGSMGQPMARNLLKAGHNVVVYNRTRSKAEELQIDGAGVAEAPYESGDGDVVLTMLANDDAVAEMVLGEKGVAPRMKPGSIHVSMSTISPALSQKLADYHRAAGQGYVSAPVFGRPDAAAAAKLFVVAAGSADAIQRCQPLFDALSQKTFVVSEDPVAANVIKISGNFMIASMLESLGETFAMVRKFGVDPTRYLEVLTGTLFGAPVYQNYGKIIIDQRFSPAGFKLPLGLKDVKLAIAAAESVDCPLPIASLLRDHFISAIARGYGDLDWSALALIPAEDAGLKGAYTG